MRHTDADPAGPVGGGSPATLANAT
jgi:hypothetical protein